MLRFGRRLSYSSRQLAIATSIVVVLAAVVGGVASARTPAERAISVGGVLILLGGAVALYELIARGLAFLIGRIPMPARPPSEPPRAGEELEKPTPHQPRPRHVLLAFAFYLTATTAVWLVGAVVASAGAPPHTAKGAAAAGLLHLTPVLLPTSEAAGGLTVLLVLYRWAKRLDGAIFLDIVPARWGTVRQLLLGGVAGAALGLAFVLLSSFVPHHPTHPPSVLVQAASLPGPTRWAWVVSALLLAPPIEEAMFRGAFLGGLAQTWGWPAGMLLSGATFWGLHASEWLDYWPAAAALGTLTLLVTLLRVRTRTLGACITAHFAYNLVLALAAFGFSPHGA